MDFDSTFNRRQGARRHGTKTLWALAGGIALWAAGPGAAQDEPRFDITGTLVCLDAADGFAERRACIGTSATNCMESHPAGYSTLGQGVCLSGELDYWDDRLNASYQSLRAMERQEDLDSAAAEYDWIPSQADALREMQRKWIPYRDATCDYERAQWTGGSGGGPAQASCLMYMTAEQTLYLEGMRDNY